MHGNSGASQFKGPCDELERYVLILSVQIIPYLRSFLKEVHDAVKLLQNEPKGFRSRFKQIVKLNSTADEIKKYEKRIHELRLNFMVCASNFNRTFSDVRL